MHRTKAAAKENKCLKLTLCCCSCCLWCLEKCMKFVNNQAYIQIALTGDSFCDAAKRAFWLILRNIGEIGAIKVRVVCFSLPTLAPTPLPCSFAWKAHMYVHLTRFVLLCVLLV